MGYSFENNNSSMQKLVLFVGILVMLRAVVSEPQVPCYFIFGDSLVDNGNNNLLLTAAKANYRPYGIDFPGGVTGRYTNGKNLADILAEFLGFEKYMPPFATAKGEEIVNGVNYGSGAAGIRDETGRQQGDVISLNRQLINHETTISRLGILLGSKKAAEEYVRKCLYTVGMGNNDYINNFLMPQFYPSSRLYSPEHYATLLIQQYSDQLKTLYNLGARKVAVFGLGQIGCIPMYITSSGCSESINNAVQLADVKLKPMVDDLNSNLPGAEFIYINTTSISLGDPSSIGITVLGAPCCRVSTALAAGQCVAGEAPCSNRTEYIFYDNFHPTEIANFLTASRAYTALLPTDAYPVDIRGLVSLDGDNSAAIHQVVSASTTHHYT